MQVIPVRTSERTTFKECRQKWWWGYVEAWSTKRERPALRFGSLVHGALEVYYKPGKRRGQHPAKSFQEIYRAELEAGHPTLYMKGDENSDKSVDALDLGTAMMEEYVKLYGKDERYEIVQPEQNFQIDINNPKTGKYLFTYVSTMDAVIRDLHTGKLGLFEHKTSANLQPFGAPLTLDEQASAYWTFGTLWLQATGKLKPDEDLDFMLYNFLRKAMPDTRPKNADGHALNKNGSVSLKQPAPLFRREQVMRGAHERTEVYRRALNEFREMQMVRQGKLAVYKNPGRHCGYCPFKDVCEVHETGSDYQALLDNLFDKWDPYELHQGELLELEDA